MRWSERIFWEVAFYKTWRQSLASPVNLAQNLPVVTITQNVKKTGVVYFFSLTLLPPRDPVGVLLNQMFKTSQAFLAWEKLRETLTAELFVKWTQSSDKMRRCSCWDHLDSRVHPLKYKVGFHYRRMLGPSVCWKCCWRKIGNAIRRRTADVPLHVGEQQELRETETERVCPARIASLLSAALSLSFIPVLSLAFPSDAHSPLLRGEECKGRARRGGHTATFLSVLCWLGRTLPLRSWWGGMALWRNQPGASIAVIIIWIQDCWVRSFCPLRG